MFPSSSPSLSGGRGMFPSSSPSLDVLGGVWRRGVCFHLEAQLFVLGVEERICFHLVVRP